MQKIVVFTGAGVSAESGIQTFRDNGGLWENYNISEVATPEAFEKDPKLVLNFYNLRRKQLCETEPNKAHQAIADLEKKFDVHVVTQNIDDLHEKAGSSNVLHLHGELMKARSTKDESRVYRLKDWKLNYGDKCELGSQLRPHVVWFGEAVPNMEKAYKITEDADILIVVGTSLSVYPAAGMVDYAPPSIKKYLIDPGEIEVINIENLKTIREKAGTGVRKLADRLLSDKPVQEES